MKIKNDQNIIGPRAAQANSPVLSHPGPLPSAAVYPAFRIPTETLRCVIFDPSVAPSATAQEDLISKKELASRLKVSTRTITNWQRRGAVPFVKCGRAVYYNWRTVVAHLQSNFRVCPTPTHELLSIPVIGTAGDGNRKEKP